MVGAFRRRDLHVVVDHADAPWRVAEPVRQSAIHRNRLEEKSEGTPALAGYSLPCVPFFFLGLQPQTRTGGYSATRQPLDGGEELVVAVPPRKLQSRIPHGRHQPTQRPGRRSAER
jgi:hypothetical protein